MGSHLRVTLSLFPLLSLPQGLPQWAWQVEEKRKGELCTSQSVMCICVCVVKYYWLGTVGRKATHGWEITGKMRWRKKMEIRGEVLLEKEDLRSSAFFLKDKWTLDLCMSVSMYTIVCKTAQCKWSICFSLQSCALYITLSWCQLISRIDNTGNHWRVIVLRIWERKELKNDQVCLLVNMKGFLPFYNPQLPLSF